ncbi:unnamed protein product [Cylindrotheca closterium]|uniref:Transmembrane protein n=1 Tax=Cylindrotheca closterium TaxID=2856 RepID=A0AAD2CFV3_9STRA|nr:unnamed protein product [Cylindrotheca closterium]
MNRFFLLAIALFQVLSLSTAFAPATQASVFSRTAIFAEEDPATPSVERGVSVDQDGKSNVWAIEPKMEVASKSSEEKTASALIAGGGLAVFAVIAGVVLTNLPDPNQF